MLWLDCPRCGRRPLDEFAFGGERRTGARRIEDADARDFDEVWIFDNPDGATTERWFHAAGCRRWLTVRRDTSTDTVVEVLIERLADRATRPPRPRPDPVRARRDRRRCRRSSATAGGRARVRRDRPGRRRRRASSTVVRPSSTAAGIDDGRLRRRRAEPGRRRRSSAGARRFARSALDGDGRRRRSAAARRWTRPRRSRSTRQRRAGHVDSATTTNGLAPGPPARRRPDDRRDRAPRPTRTASSPTRPSAGRATSATRACCRSRPILDPELTIGLPPGPTAATGVDAMTHSLESLLSRNPNPFAEAIALGVIRTVGEWLPRAVDDGTDLEARSQMLLAAHLAGRRPAERHGRRARPRDRPRDRDARPAAPRDGARDGHARGPRDFYLGVRDRELALVGGRARRRRPEGSAEPRPLAPAVDRRPRRSSARVGQRRTLARARPRPARLRHDRPGRHRRRGDQQQPAAARSRPRPGRSWRPSPADPTGPDVNRIGPQAVPLLGHRGGSNDDDRTRTTAGGGG